MGRIIGDGVTFDDVLLVPQYSEVTPNLVEISTRLTKKINLKHTFDERGDGYGYGAPHGDCYGKTGRYRYHP